MAHRTVQWLACLAILGVTSAKGQSRWSRQISSYTADISDWVPLSGPVEREPEEIQPQIKRQAVAEPRILSEPFPPLPRPTGFGQDNFPSRTFYNPQANRQQLYLQSVPAVPTAPQNYLTEQGFGQSIRFGLSQPNFPLTQGFVAPPLAFERAPPPSKPRTQIVPPNPVQFPTQGLPLSSQPKPFNDGTKIRPELPKFIDGYRAENASNNYAFNKKNPQSLQKIKFDNVDKPRAESIPQNNKVEREEVQLLYVPLESLNRGQYNLKNPLTSPHLLNSELYSQGLPKPGPSKQTFLNEYQRIPPKPLPNYSNQNYFSDFNTQIKDDQVKFSTITSPFPTLAPSTLRPKKLKPHQPPLAIFMTKEMAKTNQVKVGDVLSSLKNVDTIAVLDSVNPLNAPKVFIGPSSLPPPENYVRFELPYLSNIENSENKIKQLPFFVAPLSYNTPQGFAKIPFPSPHVGSVVINSQIKESTHSSPLPPKFSNPYISTQSSYKQEYQVTQKPTFSYFSTTSPQSKPAQNNYQSNYYSIEPQTVSSVRPPKQPQVTPSKPGSYFLSNAGTVGNQYNTNKFSNFPSQENFKSSEAIEPIPPAYHIPRRPEFTTTQSTTTTTTNKPPSTYPSQLLETHNPYSINQAFHFSTPLDYHNYFDDIKQPQVTSSSTVSPTPPSPKPSTTQLPEQVVTEKAKYHQPSTPVYLESYSPEIHYDSKEHNWRYPVLNTNDYTPKTEVSSEAQSVNPIQRGTESYLSNKGNEYSPNVETQVATAQENNEEEKTTSVSDVENPPRYDQYSQYENSNAVAESASTSSSTTTTSTKRTPLRTRGRPRYTTSRPDPYETSTRTVITRRPFRERKPLPGKRYEPNKITTENPYKGSTESVEGTTKYTRTKTRGRIQYKPSDSDEFYDKRTKTQRKEEDLAYQRDVLHQNYPVTLMERMSTVDIEAITEPASKANSNLDSIIETSDTENAYTNEKASISQHTINTESKEEQIFPIFTPRAPSQVDTSYVPKFQSSHNDEYSYEIKSSVAPTEHISYEQPDQEEEDIYVPQSPVQGTGKLDKAESNAFATEPIAKSVTEQSLSSYTSSNEYSSSKQEETTTPEFESNQESHISEEDENVVQTTPSYNRVRVRPGVIRQYHQASSTESPKPKDKRRPQSVTYRPAYERRRTTMRIEEIEADLKTKPVHSRTDSQENRHPVYKPDPTTQSSVTSADSSESSTKRGQYRRRRPSYSYTTSTTEASSSTKKIYETKNRFRGRRPTEKPTEKPETQTEVSSSTVKNSLHARYSQRLKLSDRYNKKPDPRPEVEDQAPNFSINIPKYAEPEQGWSPKVNSDSFKPYNPNNIVDDLKIATTERRSDKEIDLDIITARNDYEDILIPVTPATNRQDKKIAEIPPTLEAYVEQSKVTKSESNDNMSTFESMLEEVMKSLDEQDQDEYTKNVMKHKGGEIGEIPPERIITSGDNYVPKATTITQQDVTTVETTSEDSAFHDEEETGKHRRRGFWKKVKVRPVTTESIEFAESQYYPNTVNRLGHPVSKTGHEKSEKNDKVKVTTYKPSYQFIKNLFESDDYIIPAFDDLTKVDKTNKEDASESLINEESQQTTVYVSKEIQTDKAVSPGDLDLGTGSPDPTLDDLYTTEPTKSTIADRVDKFSFMDYLFGVTSEDNNKSLELHKVNKTGINTNNENIGITSASLASKVETTETSFMPEEMSTAAEETADNMTEVPKSNDNQKSDIHRPEAATEISVTKVETSSVSSFMSPANVVSTSMSTEVSHETEICFRGKCIKTSRDLL